MADHHLVLDTNQVQQVLNILGTRPFNEVAPLIQKIAAQLQPAAQPSGQPSVNGEDRGANDMQRVANG